MKSYECLPNSQPIHVPRAGASACREAATGRLNFLVERFVEVLSTLTESGQWAPFYRMATGRFKLNLLYVASTCRYYSSVLACIDASEDRETPDILQSSRNRS